MTESLQEFKGYGGIYKIISPSGKFYIGSTKDLRNRWWGHSSSLRNQTHPNKHLQNAWNKYNGDLKFKVLLVCEQKDLLFYEQKCIDQFQPEYNILKIAGSSFGYKRSPETVEKHRQKLLGKKLSAETRAKMSAAHKGVWNGPGMTGKKHSEETKEKMRIAGLKRYGKL